MKKIFLSLLVLAATMNVLAANTTTAKVKIKVVSDNYTTELAPMVLGEKEGLGTEVSSSSAEIYLNENPAMAMYAMYNSKKYQQLFTGTLGEMPLGIKCAETNNKLVVMEQFGTKLYLKDLQENVVIELSADAEYSFSIAAGKVGTYIEDRFQLYVAPEALAYTRDVTGGQWGTICYPAAITEVQGGVLYELTGVTETQVYAAEVDLSGNNTTVAGQPYVFKANADATQLVMPYTGTDAEAPATATGLVGTFKDITVPAGAYGIMNNYVVEIAEGNALKANRAYIKLDELPNASLAPVRGHAIFMLKNTPTNLEGATVNGLQNGTYMVNGQLVIVKDGKMFNILGL